MNEKDIYWKMYADTWAFHKKYINNVSDDDSYWDSVVNESNAIAKRYNECKFIVNLMLNEICEFERLYKEAKANAET